MPDPRPEESVTFSKTEMRNLIANGISKSHGLMVGYGLAALAMALTGALGPAGALPMVLMFCSGLSTGRAVSHYLSMSYFAQELAKLDGR